MTTTRERALEAALRRAKVKAQEAIGSKITGHALDAMRWVAQEAQTALALPPSPQPSPVAAGEHTPGPWHAEYDGDPCQVGTEGGRFVAMTLPCDATVGTAEDYANARLIAAAPDMLAALQWIVEFCDEHPEWTENELCNGRDDSAEAGWLQDARAAIARATGQED